MMLADGEKRLRMGIADWKCSPIDLGAGLTSREARAEKHRVLDLTSARSVGIVGRWPTDLYW